MSVRPGWIVSVVAAAVLGCGTQRVQIPGVPPPEDGQAAILRGHSVPLAGHYVSINTVDGIDVPRTGFKKSDIELPGGRHLVTVGYIDGYARSVEDARLVLDAKPGRRYRAYATGVREGFFSEFAKGIVGGSGKWVAWIEDEDSGDVVAGQRAGGLFTTTLEEPDEPTDAR